MLRPCHGLSRYCSTSEYGPLLGRGGQIVNKASANVPQYIDPFCVVRLFCLLWLGQLSPLLSAARMASGVVPHVNSDGNCESSFIARLTRFQSFEPRLVPPPLSAKNALFGGQQFFVLPTTPARGLVMALKYTPFALAMEDSFSKFKN